MAEAEQCDRGDRFWGLVRRERDVERLRLVWREEDCVKMRLKRKLMRKLELVQG